MKKIILLVFAMIISLISFAQREEQFSKGCISSYNTEVTIKKLTERIENLEKELSVLRLANNLSELKQELDHFKSDIDIKNNQIDLRIISKSYSYLYFKTMNKNYPLLYDWLFARIKQFDLIKKTFSLLIDEKAFSKDEEKIFMAKIDSLEKTFPILKNSLSLYKQNIELYEQELKKGI